jgi:SH3-like domain-containing protein
MMSAGWLRVAVGVMLVALSMAPARAAEQAGTASGLPVPRFVSLKSDKVNVRAGPTKDHDVAWVYSRAALPVEVTAEFENWRRIRDWEGAEGWVYHSLLSGRRTALVSQPKGKTELVRTACQAGRGRRRHGQAADRRARQREALPEQLVPRDRRRFRRLGRADPPLGRLSGREGGVDEKQMPRASGALNCAIGRARQSFFFNRTTTSTRATS